MRSRRFFRRLQANLRYLFALISRFRVTVLMLITMFGAGPLFYFLHYPTTDGKGITYGAAFTQVYFLLFAQSTLPYVDDTAVEVVNMIIPPLGIAGVIDSGVRFAFLYFSKHRNDKEWIEVITRTMHDHVIVCGAGRVGYRVVLELLDLGHDIVVIEKRTEAAFVSVLRDKDVQVLIDDIKSPQCLTRLNVQHAAAIVCATDDDLANLNVALDARRMNPGIRVVIRLFDDDLVARVRGAFRAEALSTSALAAPALALAALDPRIVHSFRVSGALMVVSNFIAQHGLPGMSIGELRDTYNVVTLAIKKGKAAELISPADTTKIMPEDVLTVQARYEHYRQLRAFTNEARPPMSNINADGTPV